MRKIDNLRVQLGQLEAKVQDYTVQINYLKERITSLEKLEPVLQNQCVNDSERTS